MIYRTIYNGVGFGDDADANPTYLGAEIGYAVFLGKM
jgi:hypothetical protein